MEPEVGYSLTHAKTALEDRGLDLGGPPARERDRGGRAGVRTFEQPPLLVDLAPTILAALDAPAQVEHTGRALHEFVGSEAKVAKAEASAPSVQIPGMLTREETSSVTDTEADEMEEHLRGLGYLE
jgi:hypothetical protein